MSVNSLDATEGRRYRCVAVCCPSAYHPTSRQACVPSAADLCIKRATSVDVRIAGCCICAIARDRLPGNRLEYLRLAAAGDDAAAASLPSRRTPGLARASAAGAPLGSGVHQAFNSINTQVSIGNSLPSAIGPPAIGQIGNGLSHPGCFPVPCAIAPVVRPACCRTLRRPNFCTSCSHPARANAIGLARASALKSTASGRDRKSLWPHSLFAPAAH